MTKAQAPRELTKDDWRAMYALMQLQNQVVFRGACPDMLAVLEQLAGIKRAALEPGRAADGEQG